MQEKIKVLECSEMARFQIKKNQRPTRRLTLFGTLSDHNGHDYTLGQQSLNNFLRQPLYTKTSKS